MRINCSCLKCTDKPSYINVEINEAFFSGKTISCSEGHEFFFISASPRSQFLIQQGVESFLKGYYFESFHTLYSAYEAYKKEFVAAHSYNEIKDLESVKTMLTKLDRSERLEGAYVTSFISLSNGKVPISLSRSAVELRNNVVHKGILPDKASCEKIGNAVFKFIGEGNLLIAKRCMEETDRFPLNQLYETDSAQSELKKKGFDTSINSPEDFYNKDFISYSISLNILSSMTLIQDKDITDHMFTDQVKNGHFIIS